MPRYRRHRQTIRLPASICCPSRLILWSRKIDYALLKLVHVSCVAASYTFFFVRGIWMMRESPLLRARWVRVLPHVVDSLLLASAITMAAMLRQYPFVAGWLTAKVLALFCYIALGVVALGRGSTRTVRIAAWIAAQVVFFYIVAVAISRDPLPWRILWS